MEVSGKMANTTQISSEEVRLYCSPCRLDNNQEKAVGYCEECKEYLCETCEDYHRKFRMSRTHRILKGTAIPPSSLPSQHTACTEVCEKHPDEYIKYICYDHNVLGCGPCTLISHRACKIGYIPDVARTFKDTKGYKTLETVLDKTDSKLNEIKRKVRIDRSQSKSLLEAIGKDIQSFRKEINAILDKREQILLNRANQLENKNKTIMDKTETREAKARHTREVLKRELEQNKEQLSQLFITAKRIEPDVQRLQSEIDDIIATSEINYYKFTPSVALETLIKHESCLGEILPVTISTVQSNIAFDRKINVKHSDDKKRLYITGISVLSPGKVLLVDGNNDILKLVNTVNQEVTAFLKLSNKPFDVTGIPNNQSAVTLPNKKQIDIISVESTLTKTKDISLSIRGSGISYFDETLIVSGSDANDRKVVQILDLDGILRKTISVGLRKDSWYSGEFYLAVAVCSDKKLTCICTLDDQHNLLKITSDGKCLLSVKPDSFSSPAGLATLTDNDIAIISREENQIRVISKKGETKKFGCMERPLAMAFSEHSSEIYMTCTNSEGRDSVYVYKLLPQIR